MDKQKLYEIIENKSQLLTGLSDKIWEYAELSMLEYKSVAAYVQILKEEGFEVVDCLFTDVNRYLPFQFAHIRIFSWIQFRDIVFFSHFSIASIPFMIYLLLFSGRFPSRNYSNNLVLSPVTVTDNTEPIIL